MPDLTLADVERLEKLRDERDATIQRLSKGGDEALEAWRVACKRYNDESVKARNALLSLAREALERRNRETPR